MQDAERWHGVTLTHREGRKQAVNQYAYEFRSAIFDIDLKLANCTQ